LSTRESFKMNKGEEDKVLEDQMRFGGTGGEGEKCPK
jgi:hypothetical protein